MGVGFSWAHRRKSLGRRKGRADQDRIPQSRQWAFKQEHSSWEKHWWLFKDGKISISCKCRGKIRDACLCLFQHLTTCTYVYGCGCLHLYADVPLVPVVKIVAVGGTYNITFVVKCTFPHFQRGWATTRWKRGPILHCLQQLHSSQTADLGLLPISSSAVLEGLQQLNTSCSLLAVEKAIDKSAVRTRFGWVLLSGKSSLFILSHHSTSSSPSNLFHDKTW